MALTDVEKSFLYNYSQQLLQQDMLTNQLFGASKVGQDLRSLVLGDPVRAKTFTNPFEEAISGTLRADAQTTRQASRNVGEAASMMGIAENAMDTIISSLEQMSDIIDEIDSGELDGSDSVVQSNYTALKNKITTTISNTSFNQIYMLDSTQWNTNQIDSNGNVYIQASNDGGYNLGFYKVDQGTSDGNVDWSDLDGSVLGNDVNRGVQDGYIDDLKSFATAVRNMYKTRQADLESEELALQSQAQLLDNAAQLRKPSDPDYSIEKLLADLVAREIGTIYDSNG